MTIRTHIGKQEESQEERPIQLRSVDPGSPEQDQLWLNTTEKRIKFFDGVSVQPTISTVPNEPVITKVAGYLIQPSDGVVLGDATAGDITLDLPAAAANEGKKYIISKIDSSSNLVIIDPNAAELIDGRTTIELNRVFQTIQFISDGIGWSVISSNLSRCGKHILTAPVAAAGAISDLTFNNLVVGRSYRVYGAATFKSAGTVATAFAIEVKNGATVLVTVPYAIDLGTTGEGVGGWDMVFTATSTTVTFDLVAPGAGHSIEGTAADAKTYAILEENNMHQQTNEWD